MTRRLQCRESSRPVSQKVSPSPRNAARDSEAGEIVDLAEAMLEVGFALVRRRSEHGVDDVEPAELNPLGQLRGRNFRSLHIIVSNLLANAGRWGAAFVHGHEVSRKPRY